MKHIKVVELFAGVGGFRKGLEDTKLPFETIWSNQWEPNKKVQHASDCYVRHFDNGIHVSDDINKVKIYVPEHDLLVGGFPCQDYSVATTNAKGLHGKKGVLWWDINDIICSKKPNYIVLENVDRLLRSPSKQRGRDFGVILWCLNDKGYNVEWRVINAADYGFPQKRRRIFIFATKKDTNWGKHIKENITKSNYLEQLGFYANEFPTEYDLNFELNEPYNVLLPQEITELSDNFEFHFFNSGVMIDSKVWTKKLKPEVSIKKTLGEILETNIDDKYLIPDEDLEKWRKAKGSKNETRKTKEGFEYNYSEGNLPFPDKLDEPARTILTGEGGLTPSRVKHIILDPNSNKYRVLTPVEVERMNGFPDNWTAGMPEGWRYFCMGNALVVGIISKIGKTIYSKI